MRSFHDSGTKSIVRCFLNDIVHEFLRRGRIKLDIRWRCYSRELACFLFLPQTCNGITLSYWYSDCRSSCQISPMDYNTFLVLQMFERERAQREQQWIDDAAGSEGRDSPEISSIINPQGRIIRGRTRSAPSRQPLPPIGGSRGFQYHTPQNHEPDARTSP